MTKVIFKYKTKSTSGLSWSKIEPCWTRYVKSRDEIEKLAEQVWNIRLHVCAVMWESTAFFGEESREAVPPMSQKEYLEGSGSLCPSCRSSKLEGDYEPTDGGINFQLIFCFCSDCGASWYRKFKLSGYCDLEEGKRADQ